MARRDDVLTAVSWIRVAPRLNVVIGVNKNPTEEGLASLHTVLSRPGHCMWRAAMNYYCGAAAENLSFRELFNDMKQFCEDEELRWGFALRVKRGFEDTSIPGSFCKDQMYLEGALRILQQIDEIDFNALYMGQIALEDVERLRQGGEVEKIVVPWFMKDMDRYKDKLRAIIHENNMLTGDDQNE